jgi:hypothetical protein
MLDIIRYYSHEFVLRYSPRTLEKVCILGPGGSGRVEIATFLASMLQYSAGAVEVRQCGQESSLERESTAKSLDAESLAETPNRSRVSLPIVVKWMFKEWLKEFSKSRNLTLHITEDCYDDSLIATQWRRGSYLAWLVRLFAKIVPSHDLWILLDQHARDSQSKEPRGPMRKTDESFEACLAFVKTKCRQAILDASASTAEVTEEAYSAIIDTLARRAGDVIEKRFKLARDAGRQ